MKISELKEGLYVGLLCILMVLFFIWVIYAVYFNLRYCYIGSMWDIPAVCRLFGK